MYESKAILVKETNTGITIEYNKDYVIDYLLTFLTNHKFDYTHNKQKITIQCQNSKTLVDFQKEHKHVLAYDLVVPIYVTLVEQIQWCHKHNYVIDQIYRKDILVIDNKTALYLGTHHIKMPHETKVTVPDNIYNFLPLKIYGSSKLKPIKYLENKGSAQCKSSIIFAGMRTYGTTIIKAKKSRNHTELLSKHLKLPISIKSGKKFDEIKIKKVKKINTLNYDIPSDISSSAFFIVLTVLSKNSELIIKNVNINPSRVGIITILKKMGADIIFKNKKSYKGEKKADIKVVGAKNLKAINCPPHLNSVAIDEFLVIFLVAAKAKGVSYFRNLGELNHKESPRLNWAEKILKNLGVRTITTNDSIKIYANPNLNLKYNKIITIKN